MAKSNETRGLGKSFEDLLEDTGDAFSQTYLNGKREMFTYTEEERKLSLIHI